MLSEQEFSLWARGRINEEREYSLVRQVVPGYHGITQKWVGVDEYAAVFSKAQIEKSEFDTVLFDIDAHGEGESWVEKTRKFLAKCETEPSRMYQTGRGVHVYFDLDEDVKGLVRYKRMVLAMVKRWGVESLIDRHVVGDVRRMARLPQSRNGKGGYMVRVEPEAFDVEVVGEPETVAGGVPRQIHVTIHETDDVERTFGPVMGAKRLYQESEYAPCVRAGIRELMETGELNHSERLHIFSYLVQNDEMDKAWQLLKTYAGDFDPRISEYQLGYLQKTNFMPFKCVNVPQHLCPYQNQRECVYWPSVNVNRRQRMEGVK